MWVCHLPSQSARTTGHGLFVSVSVLIKAVRWHSLLVNLTALCQWAVTWPCDSPAVQRVVTRHSIQAGKPRHAWLAKRAQGETLAQQEWNIVLSSCVLFPNPHYLFTFSLLLISNRQSQKLLTGICSPMLRKIPGFSAHCGDSSFLNGNLLCCWFVIALRKPLRFPVPQLSLSEKWGCVIFFVEHLEINHFKNLAKVGRSR